MQRGRKGGDLSMSDRHTVIIGDKNKKWLLILKHRSNWETIWYLSKRKYDTFKTEKVLCHFSGLLRYAIRMQQWERRGSILRFIFVDGLHTKQIGVLLQDNYFCCGRNCYLNLGMFCFSMLDFSFSNMHFKNVLRFSWERSPSLRLHFSL